MAPQRETRRRVILVAMLSGLWATGLLPAPADAEDKREWVGPAPADERPFHLGMQATAPWKPGGLRLGVRAAAGAVVTRVTADSPAAGAGLRPGDLVVRFGPYEILNVEDLIAACSLSPRETALPVTFVRQLRRIETHLVLTTLPDARPLAWYVHPSGAYRFQVPVAWQIATAEGEARWQTIVFDVIDSAEGHYRLECRRRPSPAPDVALALAEFVERTSRPERLAAAVRTTLAGAPAAWTSSQEGVQERAAVYRLAVILDGWMYEIEMRAPAGSELDGWPLPLQHVLGTFQAAGPARRAVPPSFTPPPGLPPSAAPPPVVPARGKPEGVDPTWLVYSAGDVRVWLPPDWKSGDDAAPGEGVWRVGEWESPEASLAVLRNRPWQDFAGRVESPRHSTATIGGRRADIYEGAMRGGVEPAWLRVVILPAEGPLSDGLTWVCYCRLESRQRWGAQFDEILSRAQHRSTEATDDALPVPRHEPP